VDYWPLWTLLIFFMSYVPYIGLAVALVPPCLLAFAETGIVPVIIIVVVAIIINTVVENFLAPVATGKTLRLSPTVVFISFLLWTWLLGPAGALLSMPITVLVMLVLQTSEQTQWAAEIIGSTPVSEIPAATATEG
jgi:predicted PurR-regulated permease PerM